MRIDIGDIVKGVQQRLSVLGAPERLVSELLDMLRDTHRILLRFEETMDRLDKLAQGWDEKLSSVDFSPERMERLEQALFNIERGMTGVEASVGALPRAIRTRIDRGRRPTAGESPATPRRPY
jgi:DNA repair ATPase RecN